MCERYQDGNKYFREIPTRNQVVFDCENKFQDTLFVSSDMIRSEEKEWR